MEWYAFIPKNSNHVSILCITIKSNFLVEFYVTKHLPNEQILQILLLVPFFDIILLLNVEVC